MGFLTVVFEVPDDRNEVLKGFVNSILAFDAIEIACAWDEESEGTRLTIEEGADTLSLVDDSIVVSEVQFDENDPCDSGFVDDDDDEDDEE